MIGRGEIWWAELGEPSGSEPGFRRPVLVVQSNDFNKSLINTIIVITLTSNTRLAQAPGNVLLRTKQTGLPKDSVANVSQIITLDKSFLTEKVGKIREKELIQIENGLKLVLGILSR